MTITNLDRFTVMNAQPGKRYTAYNPETRQMEVVRCDSSPMGPDFILFTRDSCPLTHNCADVTDPNYSKVYQHIRPTANGFASHKRDQFAEMFATREYVIA